MIVYNVRTPPCTHLLGDFTNSSFSFTYRTEHVDPRTPPVVDLNNILLPKLTLLPKGTNLLSNYRTGMDIPNEVESSYSSFIEAIKQTQVEWSNYDFISYRNTISRLSLLCYIPDPRFNFWVTKRGTTVFFGLIDTPQPITNEFHRRALFIGKEIERRTFPNSNSAFINVQCLSMKCNKLGLRELKGLVACETDCVDKNGNFLELKTSNISSVKGVYYKGEKAMRTYIQCVIGGVDCVCTVLHNNGIIYGTEVHKLDYFLNLGKGLPHTTQFNNVRAWNRQKIMGLGTYLVSLIRDCVSENTLYRGFVNREHQLEVETSDSVDGVIWFNQVMDLPDK
ncbi:hypothetical protein RCL1_002374 [Eukaryota sp. TZLM3-RCL]